MKTLTIFRKNGTWMFNDSEKEIIEEPLVQGFGDIIDQILKDFNCFSGAHRGIEIQFSSEKESNDMVCVEKTRNLYADWAEYKYKDLIGDLCPVTCIYLDIHPEKIWVKPIKKNFNFSFKIG
jgi:hypothetical protein